MKGSQWSVVILLLLVILAFSLRVVGVFHAPGEPTGDEHTLIISALAAGSGDLLGQLSGAGGWPGAFHEFILVLFYGAYFVVLKMLDLVPSLTTFGLSYWADRTPFVVIARSLTVMEGSVVVMVLFAAGRRAYSTLAGLLAAAFYAVVWGCPESHGAILIVPLTFFSALVLLPTLRIAEGDRKVRYYLLGGSLVACATATQYSGVLLAIPLMVSHLFPIRGSNVLLWLKKAVSLEVLSMVLAFVGTLCLVFPQVWLYPHRVIAGLQFMYVSHVSQTTELSIRYPLISPILRAQHHLLSAFPQALGLPLYVLCLLGVLYAVFRHRAIDLAVTTFVVTFFVTLGVVNRFAGLRYLLPLMPWLLLLAGRLLADLLHRLQAHSLLSGAKGAFVALSLILIFVLPPAVQFVLYDIKMAHPPTTVIARQWIEANLPAGSTIAMEGTHNDPGLILTPELIRKRYEGQKRFEPLLDIATLHPLTYNVYFLEDAVTADELWNVIHENGVQYVVTSNKNYEYLYTESSLERDPDYTRERRKFYDALREQARLLVEISPDQTHVGPVISVYQLSQ